MCRAVTCKTCGKTTWAGCGQHVDQVRSQVSKADWCGHPDGGTQSSTGTESGRRGGLLSRLLGRG